MICNIFLCVMPRPSMASASGCYQGGAKSFAQHGVMRFVAALLGLRAQNMKTGAPAQGHPGHGRPCSRRCTTFFSIIF